MTTRPCPACTSILDGWNGQVPQIAQRIAFAAVSSATPEQLAAIKKERGWDNITLVSAQGTDYQTLYHGQTEDAQQTFMNVFTRGRRHDPAFLGRRDAARQARRAPEAHGSCLAASGTSST